MRFAAALSRMPRRVLKMARGIFDARVNAVAPTIDEVRRMYGPPRTLGCSDSVRMALDSALADQGFYGLLQHSIQAGMGLFPQFMGYGALQGLSQNGLVRACVSTVADDMTRRGIELQRSGGDDRGASEERIAALNAALSDFNVMGALHEAVELAGYEGGAFVFIDTGAEGDDLLTPLALSSASAEVRRGGRLHFRAVDPVNVFPGDYNSLNPLRSDYYRPRDWWVLGRRVHASRLLRIVANEVPVLLRPAYNFLGIAQAQILWDYVLHFQECRAAEARLLTKFSMTVFKTSMQDILYSSAGTGQLDARIRYFVQNQSNDGVMLIDKESEDISKLDTSLTGVTDIVKQALEFIAAVNRTPAVKLLGISPSGFNATGESDLRNYYDHIGAMQEKVLRSPVRTMLDCLQLHLWGDIDGALTFRFSPLGEEDCLALATLQKTRADTAAVYLDRSVVSPEEVRQALAADPDSPFNGITPEELPEIPEPGREDLDGVDKAGGVYG